MATTGSGSGSGMGQSRDRVAASDVNRTGLGDSWPDPGGNRMGAGEGEGSRASSGTGSLAGNITEKLRTTTYQQLDGQKARASETLGSVAGAVRNMTQPLRENGQEGIASYVDQAANGLERWATDLRQQEVEDALRAVQRFARRQPALFLGIAFTAGVVTARFLKSSGSDGSSRQRYTMPRSGPRPTADYAAAPFGTTTGDIPRVSPDIRSSGEVI